MRLNHIGDSNMIKDPLTDGLETLGYICEGIKVNIKGLYHHLVYDNSFVAFDVKVFSLSLD